MSSAFTPRPPVYGSGNGTWLGIHCFFPSLSFPLFLDLSLSFCLSPLEEFRSGAVTLDLLTTLGHRQEYIVDGFVMEDLADLGFLYIYIFLL